MDAGEYRRRARRCLAQARLVSNPEARAKIINLATIWLLFAERAERNQPITQQQQQIQPKSLSDLADC
jgi:hypothetical protein